MAAKGSLLLPLFLTLQTLRQVSMRQVDSRKKECLLFLDVIRPPELLQFVDDVVPILHGEPREKRRPSELARRRLSRVRGRRSQRAFASHHDCHGDVVVGTIDVCVPKPVADVERLASFSLLQVIANLGGTLHVQDDRLTFIVV